MTAGAGQKKKHTRAPGRSPRRSELVMGSVPLPGQHIEELLTKLLDYSPEEISALEAEGAPAGPVR